MLCPHFLSKFEKLHMPSDSDSDLTQFFIAAIVLFGNMYN